jgi:hypothetical protein
MALRQGATLMNSFGSILLIVVFLAFLAGIYSLIYKGSRPPQPVPERPAPPKKTAVEALIPVVCAAILYGTFKGLDLSLRDRLAVSSPMSIWIILIGVVAPWCVGIYFAYRAARAASRTFRAIGSIELLAFLLGLAVLLVAHG